MFNGTLLFSRSGRSSPFFFSYTLFDYIERNYIALNTKVFVYSRDDSTIDKDNLVEGSETIWVVASFHSAAALLDSWEFLRADEILMSSWTRSREGFWGQLKLPWRL